MRKLIDKLMSRIGYISRSKIKKISHGINISHCEIVSSYDSKLLIELEAKRLKRMLVDYAIKDIKVEMFERVDIPVTTLQVSLYIIDMEKK